MNKHIALINRENRKKILIYMHDRSSLTPVAISGETGLSLPTVMRITGKFIKEGLIRVIGKAESTGGKPSKLMAFHHQAWYAVGVDIGTTHIDTLIVDLSARVIHKSSTATKIKEKPQKVISRIISNIEKGIRESGITKDKILGIGLGVPGLLDSKTGTVLFSPDFKWEEIQLVEPVKRRFNLPVSMENVTRTMALGEKWFGAGKEASDFICINLGYGIGAAIIIDNELYSGKGENAGEFGHITLQKDGPPCDCGNRGCLEALSSANAMVSQVRSMINQGRKTGISSLVKKDLSNLEARMIFQAAEQGDELANKVIRQAIEYIGIGLAGLINFMDPELIIVGGGLSLAGDILFHNLKIIIQNRIMGKSVNKVKIIPARLGLEAPAIGAATLIIKKFLENAGEMSPADESVEATA
jgi:glucokinase-like ROK family protein